MGCNGRLSNKMFSIAAILLVTLTNKVVSFSIMKTSVPFLRSTNKVTTTLSLKAEAATISTDTSTIKVPGRPTWQQSMLRIADPVKSVAFYQDQMGMTLVDTFDFPQWNFKIFFMVTLPEGETYTLIPGTSEAHDYMWSIEGTALELTYNYGTEEPSFEGYHSGNEGKDGFGHIAFNTDDVYAACEKLEKVGVTFKKKPDEGRMKGLAFAYDPDGYWVEIVKRSEPGKIPNYFNFSQTMIRIKDPSKSIPFYEAMGMKVIRKMDCGDFTLYYLASNCEEVDENTIGNMFGPVLELTHNHGTEDNVDFKHFIGNEEGRQGFGHIGFLVDNVYESCDSIRKMGYGFKKEPDGGSMQGLAFAYDPDGYWVELIKRGGLEFGDAKVESTQ